MRYGIDVTINSYLYLQGHAAISIGNVQIKLHHNCSDIEKLEVQSYVTLSIITLIMMSISYYLDNDIYIL